jgi:hypothetical protein
MDRYNNEIKKFFERKPRFNVVLIKGNKKVNFEGLSKKLNFQIIDLKKLAIEEKIEFEKIDGYSDLLELLKHVSNEITKEGALLLNLDFLLSILSKKKRKQFFERALQKTFYKPIVFITIIFKDEVPDVKHQEFNYAKVLEGGNNYEI